MLTLKECLDYCDLTGEEIRAIAEHERVPEIVAAELGDMLLNTPNGIRIIERYLADNIKVAQLCGRAEKAERFHEVLIRFNKRCGKVLDETR